MQFLGGASFSRWSNPTDIEINLPWLGIRAMGLLEMYQSDVLISSYTKKYKFYVLHLSHYVTETRRGITSL